MFTLNENIMIFGVDRMKNNYLYIKIKGAASLVHRCAPNVNDIFWNIF